MNKKLHILFLSKWYPSRVSPTNGDFVQRHAEAVATKHLVTLIHVITDEHLEKSREIIEFKKNNVQTYIVYVSPSKNPILKFFRFFKSYLKIIKTLKHFNLVHLNITYPVGLIALYLKLFKKKQYLISEHWTGYQKFSKKSIGFLQLMVTKIITKNATMVCPVSKNLQDKMVSLGLKGNYYPVPNVVNTSIFNIDESSIKNFTITHISHMGNEHKNIIGILNVISNLQRKIPNLKLNLIGDNTKQYKVQLEKLEHISIKNIGQIPNNEVANYLKKSSVFVLFSNFENLPCVILESFACGIPVISTDVGGISEYFPENFGYLIQPKDEITLENSILKIYTEKLKFNKKLMHNYAENNFGIESISVTFSNIYTKILNI
ncbi:MAG: glycosyltransferase [Lutibacter sp.]|uniref:glycosyltransferase n=1 Tax=Lutibacter sp. TaxID=1925666 RepID=UPI0019E7F573|nr:glycosyltransferase [Lutibacter sp.]NOR28141.1 glycosyltransferase [Lutibacter sp.]